MAHPSRKAFLPVLGRAPRRLRAARAKGSLAVVKILLVRHAHAVDPTATLADEYRYLSEKGRQRIRAVGRAIASKEIAWDAIRTSPLVRAVQTAELLAESLDFTGVLEATRVLAPGVPARVAAEDLRAAGDAVVVVGHEPDLSSLGATLVARPSFPSFKKAEAMLLEDGRPGWRLSPDTLEFERLLVS